jgi:hypothetical protein
LGGGGGTSTPPAGPSGGCAAPAARPGTSRDSVQAVVLPGRHRRPVTSPMTQLGGQVVCPSLPPRCTYHDEPSCLIASPVETRPRVPVKAECCRHSLVAGVCRDHCSGMASFPRQMAAITVGNFSGSRPGDWRYSTACSAAPPTSHTLRAYPRPGGRPGGADQLRGLPSGVFQAGRLDSQCPPEGLTPRSPEGTQEALALLGRSAGGLGRNHPRVSYGPRHGEEAGPFLGRSAPIPGTLGDCQLPFARRRRQTPGTEMI